MWNSIKGWFQKYETCDLKRVIAAWLKWPTFDFADIRAELGVFGCTGWLKKTVNTCLWTENFNDGPCYGNSTSVTGYVFYDVRTCNLVERCQRFGGAFCLHCQGWMKMDEGVFFFSKILLVYNTATKYPQNCSHIHYHCHRRLPRGNADGKQNPYVQIGVVVLPGVDLFPVRCCLV